MRLAGNIGNLLVLLGLGLMAAAMIRHNRPDAWRWRRLWRPWTLLEPRGRTLLFRGLLVLLAGHLLKDWLPRFAYHLQGY